MQTIHNNYSVAVFPFLKTSGAVPIGRLTFRSTDATDNLPDEQAACVKEIADMLFLQDNLLIRSASYAVVPFIDARFHPDDIEYLMNVQAVVAYCYASPRHSFGDLFLSSEHASMAIFTPDDVSMLLVRPDFHVDAVDSTSELEINDHKDIKGYAGLYNFRHPFWVANGSRLYGPKPHLTLNISQDLNVDFDGMSAARADFSLLSELLRKPVTQTSTRFFTAVRWFNAANNEANDQATAIVNLSIAFEALLKLPTDEKSDRLTDVISLLLGRTPRLDVWARQFYDARSRIVHEGSALQLRFVATDSRKGSEGPLYQSLLSYGRQVFQLCVGTLLVGAELAENAGLEETLVTNQERFQKICRVLADNTIPAKERLERIAPFVSAIQQYRFVPESNLLPENMIGAVRLAAKVHLEHNDTISQELKESLERLISTKRSDDHFQELAALQILDNIFRNKFLPSGMIDTQTVRELVEVVWGYLFMHYFWLKERLQDKSK